MDKGLVTPDGDYYMTADGFVTADGQYGVGGVLVFDSDTLSVSQWEDLSELPASDRYDYVEAILEGNTKRATAILEENGLRQS